MLQGWNILSQRKKEWGISLNNKLFSAFLFDHKQILLLFFLCCGIFTGINLLYQLPLEPVLYAAVLSIIAVVLILLPHFFRYREKYLELQRMAHAIDTMTNALPAPSSCLEDRYQNLLHILGKVNAGNLVRLQKERTDLIEYYTTWAHQIKIPIAAMRLLLQEEDTSYRVICITQSLSNKWTAVFWCSLCGGNIF